MKIDASRFSMFWANPDRYRLRECWKIAPVDPAPGTFAALMSHGRRRGSAFHMLRDAEYNCQVVSGSDLEAKYGDLAVAAALRMAAAVAERYPNEQYLAHEKTFEYPIPNSEHIMTGQIDHILKEGWNPTESDPACALPVIGDWKGSKTRTKADMRHRIAKYCASPQVDFYLLGARSLGINAEQFLYRVIEDKGKGKKAVIHEAWTTRDVLQLQRFERTVKITCDLIEWMKDKYGILFPWPVLPEPFETGYESQLGRRMYEGFIPEGFTEKVEHLSTMIDEEPEGEDA